MKTLSVWRATAGEQNWSTLDADVETDVAIVGGGITGVTLALLLAGEGRSVVLLEADAIGSGTTGNSTGNLYETLGEGLSAIDAAWGSNVCRSLARSRREAMAFIEGQVPQLDANCGWRRCSVYRFALKPEAQEQVEKERRVCELTGLASRVEDGLPAGLPAPAGPVLVLEDQAQFHPMAYVRAQARRAADAGCRMQDPRARCGGRDRPRPAHRAHRTRLGEGQGDRAGDALAQRLPRCPGRHGAESGIRPRLSGQRSAATGHLLGRGFARAVAPRRGDRRGRLPDLHRRVAPDRA